MACWPANKIKPDEHAFLQDEPAQVNYKCVLREKKMKKTTFTESTIRNNRSLEHKDYI